MSATASSLPNGEHQIPNSNAASAIPVPVSTPEARSRTAEAGYPVAAGDSPAGFVSQTTGAAVSTLPDSKPEAGSRTTEAGPPVAAGDFPLGFVSQNAGPAVSTLPDSSPGPRPRTTDPVAAGDFLSERNRQNAQYSTGPKTEAGKAASARNSFKHGLSITKHVILRHEDPSLFAQLHEELLEIFEPKSKREALAVQDIAHCRWALRRFDEAETELMDYHFSDTESALGPGQKPMSSARAIAFSCILEHQEPAPLELPSIENLLRYRRHWERRHKEALAEINQAQQYRLREIRAWQHENQAIRQAENHELRIQREAAHRKRDALRQEREAAREQRQKELHELRKTAAAGHATPASGLPKPAPSTVNAHAPGFVSSESQSQGRNDARNEELRDRLRACRNEISSSSTAATATTAHGSVFGGAFGLVGRILRCLSPEIRHPARRTIPGVIFGRFWASASPYAARLTFAGSQSWR